MDTKFDCVPLMACRTYNYADPSIDGVSVQLRFVIETSPEAQKLGAKTHRFPSCHGAAGTARGVCCDGLESSKSGGAEEDQRWSNTDAGSVDVLGNTAARPSGCSRAGVIHFDNDHGFHCGVQESSGRLRGIR